ncbi:MAG: DNA repair protein RecO [Bacteroidetes bacterium]|nr:DNA repair protein RecO [Bacteroidota bacterium]
MAVLKTDVLVLKTIKFGDSSKIVTLYSKDLGKLKAIVKGARNYKSGLSGKFQPLNYLSVILYFKVNRDIQNISKAEFLNSYKNLLKDFNKLQTALKILEIINRSLPDLDPNPPLFDIVSDSFSAIDNSDSEEDLILLNFQIEFLRLSGMLPDLADNPDNLETLKTNSEFNLNENDIEFLLKMSERKTGNSFGINKKESYNVTKISECFTNYIINHNSSRIIFKSDKVFREINKLN